MQIVCPACASAYEIPAERIGPEGRTVRCAACRETWFIAPDAATALPTLLEPGLPEPVAAPVRAEGPVIEQPMPYPRAPTVLGPPRRGAGATRRRIPPRAGWLDGLRRPGSASALALGFAVLVVAPLALLGRVGVVSAMPQTAALYAGLGLPVNLHGIAFRDVVAFQTPAQDGKPAELVVEGDLFGLARADVPDLAVEVRGAHGESLYRWTVPAPRAALEPSETARFRASLGTPPAAGRSVAVRFVTEPVSVAPVVAPPASIASGSAARGD